MTEEDTEIESESESGTESTSSGARDAQPRTLGLARWVQMTFVAFGLLLLWVLDKVIAIVWDRFAEPKPVLVTLAAAAVATVATLALNKNAKVHRIVTEVIGELAKVSWPSRKETQVSTLIVIITSIIAAVIIGLLDAAWSKLTDFIYKV